MDEEKTSRSYFHQNANLSARLLIAMGRHEDHLRVTYQESTRESADKVEREVSKLMLDRFDGDHLRCPPLFHLDLPAPSAAKSAAPTKPAVTRAIAASAASRETRGMREREREREKEKK